MPAEHDLADYDLADDYLPSRASWRAKLAWPATGGDVVVQLRRLAYGKRQDGRGSSAN